MSLSPDRRREVRFALIMLLGPVLAFAAVETAARSVRSYLDPDQVDWGAFRQALAVQSDERLYLFRPNASYGTVQTDDYGLRSPQVTVPKPAGTLRLAFLGDSVTLGATLPEDQTFPAKLVQELQSEMQGCAVDYVTFAGPSYSTSFLADHWPSLQTTLKPDFAVILAGGPTEIVSTRSKKLSSDTSPSLLDRSATYDLANRLLRRISLVNLIPRKPAEDEAALARSGIDRIENNLASATAPLPSLLIAHRGRIRSSDTDARRSGTTQQLRSRMGADAGIGPVALTDAIVAMGARLAERPNWWFSDAQDRIAADSDHYRDPLHLTAQGHSALAREIADDIRPLLGNCGDRLSTRNEKPED